MRLPCHFVPALAALVLLSACYRSHAREGGECGPPPGQICCDGSGAPARSSPTACPFACPPGTALRPARACRSVSPPPPRPDDGGVGPRDAGPLECPPVRADFSCYGTTFVPPERPFELPLTYDACECCPRTECGVEVTSVLGVPTLRITTTLCPDPCDCDECVIPQVACAVPALPEGAYNVVVNGAHAFMLPVTEVGEGPTPPTSCAMFAQPDSCRVSEAPPASSGVRARQVCLQGDADASTLTATFDCFGCGDLHGPCVTRVEPRLTDDLPPGGEILLGPTAFLTECDIDCPDICIRRERRCQVPPLVPGHFYRVWSDGEPVLAFAAGGAMHLCSEL